jgi:hypothetical protein
MKIILFPKPWIAVLLVLGPTAAWSLEEVEPPVKLTLYPAPEPQPAMRYQLLPKFIDRIPGNSAVYYGKVTAERYVFFSNQEFWDKIEGWRKAPLEELHGEDMRHDVDRIVYFLDRAARCDHCDWQLPIREENFYTILLPDAQQTRQFARILAAKARIHLARGEFDQAVKLFQIGYAMGQDVAEGETLVNGLVGVGICHSMSEQVLEFVQQSAAPNLYWALTMLPRPLIDVREAAEAEMSAVELSYPEVRDLDKVQRSPEEWREAMYRFAEDLSRLSNRPNELAVPQAITAAGIMGYPRAKQALVERGYQRDEVEAMAVAQVVMLYTMQTYKDLRDEIHKWFYVPYPEAVKGMEKAEEELHRALTEKREIIPLASLVLPAVLSCRTAIVRADREIAVLRVLEALRMYAANHQGQLPGNLGDITKVAVPVDPVTGKSFDYSFDGNTARLRGPSLPGVHLNYSITLASQ